MGRRSTYWEAIELLLEWQRRALVHETAENELIIEYSSNIIQQVTTAFNAKLRKSAHSFYSDLFFFSIFINFSFLLSDIRSHYELCKKSISQLLYIQKDFSNFLSYFF